MISFTTRNRPHVLDYTLGKTREHYDGFIVIIDDNSQDAHFNAEIAQKHDCSYMFNETRLGIPRSKERGFEALLKFDKQFWFDDDCYPLPGWLDRIIPAMEFQPHILHLKTWSHIVEKKTLVNGMYEELPADLVAYSGATACFMSFTKAIYSEVKGFPVGFGLYGGWHHNLSLKLSKYGLDEYVALKDSPFHCFDIEGPPKKWKYSFQSSLPQNERVKK